MLLSYLTINKNPPYKMTINSILCDIMSETKDGDIIIHSYDDEANELIIRGKSEELQIEEEGKDRTIFSILKFGIEKDEITESFKENEKRLLKESYNYIGNKIETLGSMALSLEESFDRYNVERSLSEDEQKPWGKESV
jgi:hypothetical protein